MKKILKKVLCTFLFFQLLSVTGVYAGVQEFMEKALNSWVGYNINDMINSWGFPTDEKTIANRHIYIWNKAWSQYIPQRTNSTVTPGFYNATVNSYTTGGYNINWYCNKTIEIDADSETLMLKDFGKRFYKYIPEEKNADGSEHIASCELVRLALPRRVFTLSQVRYIADRICWLYDNRHLIGGLRFTEEPKVMRFFIGRLEPVSDWQEKLVAKFKEDFGDSL